MTSGEFWEHWQFGLIVTGKSEQKSIDRLFRTLSATGLCSFKVIRRIGQLSPITSPKRKLEMVGAGKKVPDKDVREIGFPARKYLHGKNGRFVVLIDDLEWDRKEQVEGIFGRYRAALDKVLNTPDDRAKVAVHFLVMMLEAYFFADSQTVNEILGINLSDYSGDVEEKRHPKNELSKLCDAYRETEHGSAILEKLRVDHVLARTDCCAYLRTLFNWCISKLKNHPYADSVSLPDYTGKMATVTSNQ